MEITGKIFALGNSNAIRIPRIIMEALSLRTDEPVSIEVRNNREIVIKKQVQEGYPSIQELFSDYTGELKPKEIPAVGIVGKELI